MSDSGRNDHAARATSEEALRIARNTSDVRALAVRLGDADRATRIEAVHGLALRGDLRAVEPALELLAEGESGDARWTSHALAAAARRLAQLSGDARFAPHLPPAA